MGDVFGNFLAGFFKAIVGYFQEFLTSLVAGLFGGANQQQ